MSRPAVSRTTMPRPTLGRARRAIAAAVLAGLTVAGLSSCAAAGSLVGITSAGPPPDDATAVEPQQARAILGRVLQQAGESDASRSVTQAAAVYTGPALAIARTAYTVDGALGTKVPARPASNRTPVVVLTQGSGYPRWFLGYLAGTHTVAPQLVLLTTGSADQPYAIWGQASQLPGHVLPDFPSVSDGSATLGLSQGGLVMTPGQVGSEYAELLNNGSSAPQSTTFAPDSFAQQVAAAATAQRVAVARFGTYVQAQVALPDSTWALRADDGSAIVICALKRVSTFTARSGNAATLPADVRVVTGLVQASTFTSTSDEVLVFHVPKAGKGRVQLLAATDGLVSATAQ